MKRSKKRVSKNPRSTTVFDEGQYRILFQSNPQPMWVYDLETLAFLAVNDAAVAKYGYTEEEFLRMTIKDIRPEEDIPALLENIAHVTEGLNNAGVWRHRKKDGSIIFVEITSHTLVFAGRKAELVTAFDVTTRVKVEEARSRLEQAIATSNDVVFMTDRDGRINYVNEAFEKLYGYTRSEVLGQTPRILKSGRLSPKFYQEFWSAILSGKTVRGEFSNRTKDGRLAIVQSTVDPIKDNHGQAIGFIAIQRDITEYVEARRALNESEARFRTLANTTPAAIFTYSDKFTYVNPAAESLTGYTSAELLGMSFWEVVHPEHRELVRQRGLARLRGEEVPSRYEFKILRKDGTSRWIEFSAGIFKLKGEASAIGTAFDITERKQLEERLSNSEKLYRDLVENSNEVTYLLDRKLQLTYVSLVIEHKTGYVPAELLGRRFADIIYPADVAAVEKQFRVALAGGTMKPVEFRFITKQGRTLWVRASAVPVMRGGRLESISGVAIDITEQKLAMESLKASEERFRIISEKTGQLIYDYDVSTGNIQWSGAIEHVTGYSPEDFKSFDVNKWEEYIHPDDRMMALRELDSSMKNRTPYHVEYRFRRKDGQYIHVEDNGAFLYDADGKAYRMLGVMSDITKRKLAEEQLQQSEARYRDVVENASDVIYLMDINGKFVYANPAGLKASGYSLDELLSLTYLDLVEPGYRKRVSMTYIRQVLKQIPSTIVEFPFRTKSGELRWFSQVANLMITNGKPTGFRVIARDITESKLAEEKLRQTERLYREFFENDLTGDYISTSDGWLVDCNPAFMRIFGFKSKEEALHTNLEVLYSHPEERKAFLDRIRKEKVLVYEERTARRIDGTLIHIVFNAAGVFDEKGELVQIRGYIFDDTKRKQLEEQLRHAQKMESIGTLASGIAHDLNNILSPILIASEILKRKGEDPAMLQLVNTIEKSAQRGASVVKQILTFARGVEGEQIIVDPKHLITEIFSLMEETFPKSIRLQKSISSDLKTVKGDPAQLHQVLLNLCVNARDAMPNGGILRVSAESVTLDEQFVSKYPNVVPGQYVQMVVTDTGVGIPQEIIGKIFDPFFTTKEVGKGTGLGLSMVLGIVKSHRGLIHVYSEVGKGTTFKVYLPVSEDGEKKPLEVMQDDLLRGRGERVLVVDDESSLREMMRAALESYGYHVLLAKDGAEAVALTAQYQESIQLVITDMMMPYMDGLATIKAIRRVLPEVRVIMTSGLQTNEQDALAAGISRFLLKPFTSDRLLRTVRELLSSHEG